MTLKSAIAVAAFAVSPAFAADPVLMNLVPSGTQMIAGIHVDRTVNSPFGQYLLSQMKNEDENFRKFVATTGFDPRRDVREMVLVSSGGPAKGKGMILARGVFDGPKLFAAARAEGAQVGRYGGIDVMTGHGKDNSWVAFPDNSTAVAGDAESVKQAIDRRGAASAPDPKLLAKVNDVSNRFDAWFVSMIPVAQFAPLAPEKQMESAIRGGAMEGIQQTNGGVKFGTVIQFAGEAVTRSEKDASALVDVVRFLAGMVTLNRDRPEVAKLTPLVDSLELKAEGSTVRFSASIPQSDLEQMMQPKRARRAAAAVR